MSCATNRISLAVLELAGGVLPAASLNHIEIQRLVAHEKQTMVSVDIPQNADPSEITKRLESFEIHDGDRIRIYPIATYNTDAIYLEGHVARPGRYSYRDGMRRDRFDFDLQRHAARAGAAVRRNHPAESSGFSSQRGKFQSGRAPWPIRARPRRFIRWIRFAFSADLTLKTRRPWP